MLQRLNIAVRVGISGALLTGSVAFAQQLVLPGENQLTTSQFGDFKVQSLELNQKCYDAGVALCAPSGPYPVQSSPGQIADYLLILQGGSTADNYPPLTGITGDNAFVPPQGGSDGFDSETGSFAMSNSNEVQPDGFTGDRQGTWEVQLGALLKYLTSPVAGGGIADLVFLFDNNQQGAGADQFQYIWGTASIRDENGNVMGGQCYGLFGTAGYGTGGTCATPNPTAPTYKDVQVGNKTVKVVDNAGSYVPLITDFCVSSVPPYAGYKIGEARNSGDCTDNEGDYYVSNNLGNNSAEFAAYNKDLQAYFLANAAAHPEWVLSVNLRLAHLTDGPEQAWICSACGLERLILVPEPGSLALFGLGLVGMGLMRRRRA